MAEHRLGAADTLLQTGEMRRFDLDGKPVALARVEDRYFAFRARCPHYGGPLDQGVLKGYTVMCPLHHACFDIRTGARLEPPALDDLTTYAVRIDAGQVVVDPDASPAPSSPAPADNDARTFVIVGGGAAGSAAAEELRRQRFAGKVILLSASPLAPVDRPNVSKDYLAGHAKPEWMPLRSEGWYADRRIDLRLSARVSHIDTARRAVTLEHGETLTYDRLLLATGAQPRMVNVPGRELSGIFTLREQPDADRIIAAVAEGSRAVVVGGSFIGMEAAYSLASRGAQVTVVELQATPFESVLGREVGLMLQREHEANHVKFRLGSGVERFVGEGGRVTGVAVKGGEVLPADLVVVGVGVHPATAFLDGSNIARHERDGSVLVNAYLQSSAPEVYAAGDIARRDDERDGSVRIEHWRVAQQQGIVAARNMLGAQETVSARVPFFWTEQWGIRLRYVGHAQRWDDIVYRGNLEQKDFIAFYVAGGRLLAAAGCGRDRELDALEFILRDGLPLTADQMRDPGFDLVSYSVRR